MRPSNIRSKCVKVWSENPDSGDRRHVVSAYLTYAAIDELGKPATVPPLKAETAEDRRRAREAAARRAARLELRNKR